MVKKNTSLSIDKEIWKEVKIHCIKIEKDVSDYIEELIKKDLKL